MAADQSYVACLEHGRHCSAMLCFPVEGASWLPSQCLSCPCPAGICDATSMPPSTIALPSPQFKAVVTFPNGGLHTRRPPATAVHTAFYCKTTSLSARIVWAMLCCTGSQGRPASPEALLLTLVP